MKTIIKLKSVVLIAALLLSGSMMGSAEEMQSKKTKEVSRSYTTDRNSLLSVDNTYGNIVITHWNKNEISIKVVIEAKAKTDNRANQLLEQVYIEINKSGNTISAVTKLKNVNAGNNEQLKINYIINMPADMQNKLTQKYGNITMPDKNEGISTIKVMYGNMKGGEFTKDLKIDCSYGNVKLGRVYSADVKLSYSNLDQSNYADNINIAANYSEVKLKDVKNLTISSNYGNLKAGRITIANMNFKYGNIDMGSLSESLKADVDYGNINLESLSSNFRQIDIKAQYGNIDINIPSNAAFNMEAKNMKYGKLDMKGFNSNVRNENNNMYTTVNGGGSRTIKIDGKGYSNVKIKAL